MIQAKPVQVHDTSSSETDVTTRNHNNLNPNKNPVPDRFLLGASEDNVLLSVYNWVYRGREGWP